MCGATCLIGAKGVRDCRLRLLQTSGLPSTCRGVLLPPTTLLTSARSQADLPTNGALTFAQCFCLLAGKYKHNGKPQYN